MLHLHYFRPERSRVDSCVLILPDTSAVPNFQVSEEQFGQMEQLLQAQLAAKLAAIDEEQFVPPNQEKEGNVGDKTFGNSASSLAENVVDEGGVRQPQQEGISEGGADQLNPQAATLMTESTNTAAAEVLSQPKI